MKLVLAAFPLSMGFAFSNLPPIKLPLHYEDSKSVNVFLSDRQDTLAFTYHTYVRPVVGSVKQHTNSPVYQFLISQLYSRKPITVEFLSIDVHSKKTATFTDTSDITCHSRALVEGKPVNTLFAYKSYSSVIFKTIVPCLERIKIDLQSKIDSNT